MTIIADTNLQFSFHQASIEWCSFYLFDTRGFWLNHDNTTHRHAGTYNEKLALGKEAASPWRQHMAELSLAKNAAPFYLPYKTTGLFGVSAVVSDNHLDDFMWYTLWNLVRFFFLQIVVMVL